MFKQSTNRSRPNQWRVHLFLVLVIAVAGLIFFRLFSLSYLQHSNFVKVGQNQYQSSAASINGRGDIYVSDQSTASRHLVATNRSFWYVYANNKNIAEPEKTADILAPLLGHDKSKILSDLGVKSNYRVLADHLSKETGTKINELKIKGITAAQEIDRFYSKAESLSSVLGFVAYDGNLKSGRYGIEAYYDDVLSGEKRTQNISGNRTYAGLINFFRNIIGRKDEVSPSTNDGSDIVLTVDDNIQSFIEKKLDEVMDRWQASGGSIIVQDPMTGAILAMVSSPSFNPNDYSDYALGDFPNRNVQQLFEPGSSFKSITMAAAIDSGSVTPDTTYEDTGAVQFGTYTIRNFNEKANGLQTMRQVLERSLNTGVIFAENKTGDDTFLNYVVNFGFGQKSGIDLPGEILGNIANLYSGRKINFATASFGQGIAVTPIQLVNAYSAIANGGKLMKPYIVKEEVRSDGSKVVTEPKILGVPITEKTSQKMKSILVGVVEKGFDKARVPGYALAGKTGTAQIPAEGGGYLENDQFIHNFLGFAPAENPRFTVLIKLDKPKGIKFAADSLSPVFGEIAKYLLRYFNIPPSR